MNINNTHTRTHTHLLPLSVAAGMKMSNASLLDEATAGAEAMSMCYSLKVRLIAPQL